MIVLRVCVLLALVLPSHPLAQCQVVQGLGSVGDQGARLGDAVAVSGNYAVVGSSFSDAYGVDAGAATVYRRSGDTWVTHQTLGNLVTLNPGDHFGNAVAIDGGFIAVGAYAADSQLADTGLVHVFKDNGSGTFVVHDLLWPEVNLGASAGQAFGCSVAISEGWMVVGSYLFDGSGTDCGGAYIYEQDGSGWDFATIKVNGFSPQTAGDHFGYRVAAANGIYAVGADLDDVGGSGTGTVRVYQLDELGNFPVFSSDFTQLNAQPTQAGALFGVSVAVGDNVIAVGATKEDAAGTDSGAVYVYRFYDGGWLLEQKLLDPTPQASEMFGEALAMDGTTLLVGNPRHDLPATDCGVVEVYRRAGHSWLNTAHLSNASSAQGDAFGSAVDVDGATISVGAPLDDNGTALDTGSVTAFSFTACPGLFAWRTTTTNALPDPIQFSLNAGPAYASRQYVLLGSVSGTSPGFPLNGATVPLNPDVYFNITLASLGVPSFNGFWGVLNGQGRGNAMLLLPPFVPPAVLGLTFRHAFIAKGSGPTDWYASNAEPLGLIEEWAAPHADAGSDLFIDEEPDGSTQVFFDGDGSWSSNGFIVNYVWNFGDGTSTSGGDWSVDHQYQNGGTYTAKLTVFDEVGAAAADIRVVHINQAPVGVFSVVTATPKVGVPVVFDACAGANPCASFDPDPDGSIVSYGWRFDGGPLQSTTSTIITHTFNFAGNHHIEMTPIDDDGLAGSNIAEANIQVAP